MAQRTIHYLFAEMISRNVELKDKPRFLLGSILPDAYVDVKDRDTTHFMIRGEDGNYFDFHAFLGKYYELIQKDDLYLGYYMHLVEDAFYRDIFHNKYKQRPRSMEDVKRLHKDYHILNAYIVKKYGLKNTLKQTYALEKEVFHEIAAFRVEDFLDELEEDFHENVLGETFYITESMVDEFIERYLPLALKEMRSIQTGKSCLHIEDYVWAKK